MKEDSSEAVVEVGCEIEIDSSFLVVGTFLEAVFGDIC